MKKVLAVCLAVLLLAVFGSLPAFAVSGASPDLQVTEEEKKEEEVSPNVEITEEMMKEAKPAEEGVITIEIAKEEEEPRPWEKYVYLDVDQDLNEDSQTFWTRVGTRKGNFDFSVGWTQQFNEPAAEPTDKGMVSMSMSFWW